MPDPLQFLPNELWTLCLQNVVEGQPNGPLELIMVSRHWEALIIHSPSLWSQIYIQNGDDEMARISTFLLLSKDLPLRIDVMTVVPKTDGLRLIARNVSRITSISIRPGGVFNGDMASSLVLWKESASYILATVFHGQLPSHVEDTSCLGISLPENDQLHYQVIQMSFRMSAKETDDQPSRSFSPASAEMRTYTRMWDEHISRCIFSRSLVVIPKDSC